MAFFYFVLHTRLISPFGSRPPHPRPPSACAWRERRERTTGARLRPLDSSRACGRTLARGLPPRRGVRAPRLHALSLSFFGHRSATFSYRDLVLAYSHYHCATFRSTVRYPRSCVRAPPRPSCAATATAAAAMCSPLWLLIDRARFGCRAVPHFGPESFFARQHFVWRLHSKHGAPVRHDAGRGGTF